VVLRELRLVEGIEKALLLVTVDRDLMEQVLAALTYADVC
jgi:hypothetical protein